MRPAPLAAALLLGLALSAPAALADITVASFSMDPAVFMPGDTGTVTAVLQNAGTASATMDQIVFYAPQFETLTGIYQNAGSLGAGQSTTLSFTLRAPAAPGSYHSEIQIQSGGQTTRFPVVLQVDDSRVEVLPTSVPSLIPLGGSSLTLVVANLRPNDVRSVRIVPRAEGVSFAPQEAYLDQLRSGNSTPVSFTATATAGGTRPIAFDVSFYNGDNLHHATVTTAPVAAEVSPTLEFSLDPSTHIAPGGSGHLVFRLDNRGAGVVQNIGLSWSDSANTIIPVGTTNSLYAGSLPPGGETTVSFPVASTSGAAVGVYPLNVTLQYADAAGLQRSLTQRIGVFVGGGTTIEVALQEVSGTSVSLLVANVGTSVADSVVVRAPRQPGFPVVGADSAALGNLNPGDFTFATFNVGGAGGGAAVASGEASPGNFPRRGASGSLSNRSGAASPAQIEVDYTDATGVRQSTQKELTIDFSQPFRQSLAGQQFQSRGGGLPLLEVVAVAAVAGLIYWKRAPIAARLKRKKEL